MMSGVAGLTNGGTGATTGTRRGATIGGGDGVFVRAGILTAVNPKTKGIEDCVDSLSPGVDAADFCTAMTGVLVREHATAMVELEILEPVVGVLGRDAFGFTFLPAGGLAGVWFCSNLKILAIFCVVRKAATEIP
jgi:hypothetical protein